MKTFLRALLSCIPVLALASGCVTQSSATKAPHADLTKLNSFHVVKLPEDGRGIDEVVAEQLVAMGYQATHGSEEARPDDVDALVTYQDKWMWDITMYMVQLDVQIREPDSQMVLASGGSMRTSLVRKSPSEMAREVLTKIFDQS